VVWVVMAWVLVVVA
jgi:hypothetical protein